MTASFLAAGIQLWWAWRRDAAWIRLPEYQELPKSVSIVVCLRNEAGRVARLAEALKPALNCAESQRVTVDVMAVDDGSQDDTWNELGHICEADHRWRRRQLIHSTPGKRDALHLGVASTHGEVILVLDADCTPMHDDWIACMTRGALSEWDVNVGISLPESPTSGGVLPWLQLTEAERLAQRAVGAIWAGSPYLGFGRNMAWTRDIWSETGGAPRHHEVPSGDDDLWLQHAARSGARVQACVHPHGQTRSQWPQTWAAWRRQKTRHFTASPHYPLKTLALLALPSASWLMLAVAVVHNPSVTSLGCLALSVTARTLTFGLFLHHTGKTMWGAWRLLLEPWVSLFRTWAWWKGQTSESIPWK